MHTYAYAYRQVVPSYKSRLVWRLSAISTEPQHVDAETEPQQVDAGYLVAMRQIYRKRTYLEKRQFG